MFLKSSTVNVMKGQFNPEFIVLLQSCHLETSQDAGIDEAVVPDLFGQSIWPSPLGT